MQIDANLLSLTGEFAELDIEVSYKYVRLSKIRKHMLVLI